MIRDLVERAINMVRDEQAALCSEEAERATEERILDYLLPRPLHQEVTPDADGNVQDRHERTRDKLREQLRKGDLEERLSYAKIDLKLKIPRSIDLLYFSKWSYRKSGHFQFKKNPFR